LTRPALTATLPAVRCTPAERRIAAELAAASGLSLAQYIRARACVQLPIIDTQGRTRGDKS
jgi:hypothetical protein